MKISLLLLGVLLCTASCQKQSPTEDSAITSSTHVGAVTTSLSSAMIANAPNKQSLYDIYLQLASTGVTQTHFTRQYVEEKDFVLDNGILPGEVTLLNIFPKVPEDALVSGLKETLGIYAGLGADYVRAGKMIIADYLAWRLATALELPEKTWKRGPSQGVYALRFAESTIPGDGLHEQILSSGKTADEIERALKELQAHLQAVQQEVDSGQEQKYLAAADAFLLGDIFEGAFEHLYGDIEGLRKKERQNDAAFMQVSPGGVQFVDSSGNVVSSAPPGSTINLPSADILILHNGVLHKEHQSSSFGNDKEFLTRAYIDSPLRASQYAGGEILAYRSGGITDEQWQEAQKAFAQGKESLMRFLRQIPGMEFD